MPSQRCAGADRRRHWYSSSETPSLVFVVRSRRRMTCQSRCRHVRLHCMARHPRRIKEEEERWSWGRKRRRRHLGRKKMPSRRLISHFRHRRANGKWRARPGCTVLAMECGRRWCVRRPLQGVRASRVVIVGHYRQLDGEGSGGGGGGGGEGEGGSSEISFTCSINDCPVGKPTCPPPRRRAGDLPGFTTAFSGKSFLQGRGRGGGGIIGEGGAGRIGEKVKLSIHSDQAVMSRGGNYSFALPFGAIGNCAAEGDGLRAWGAVMDFVLKMLDFGFLSARALSFFSLSRVFVSSLSLAGLVQVVESLICRSAGASRLPAV